VYLLRVPIPPGTVIDGDVFFAEQKETERYDARGDAEPQVVTIAAEDLFRPPGSVRQAPHAQ